MPGQGVHSSGALVLCSYLLLCPCPPQGLCRWASDGLVAPVMGLDVTQEDIIWALPPAVVSLSSFVGVHIMQQICPAHSCYYKVRYFVSDLFDSSQL